MTNKPNINAVMINNTVGEISKLNNSLDCVQSSLNINPSCIRELKLCTDSLVKNFKLYNRRKNNQNIDNIITDIETLSEILNNIKSDITK